MGESHGWLFEHRFNRSIKLRQADPRISDNAGTLVMREADHRLGLTADLAGQLTDDRDPQHVRYTQVELLRQHVYALALGYVHQDDQDALAHDVVMKLSVWDRPGSHVIDERLASQPSDWRQRLPSPAYGRGEVSTHRSSASLRRTAAGSGPRSIAIPPD